ncbi:hypothetical protein BT96DRAFT_822297 [Gymnopus androsaceus JB14]|uniref:Mid2 domain-containing protein n=1 Tax=Gymnopus androsaceus JB14 TaxID=1447944 RepID=A0A6A4HHL4_9AGAR|nr:hypothetical protein BT96DRAFT_822297 [Gymnopus androsaceus JB14]
MSIDNETFTSTFVAPSDLPDGTLFRHIPLWSDPPSLPDTPHTLLLNITGAINSTTGVWVDYFVYEVSESTPINDTRFFVDDRDSRIQYGDGWKPIDSNDTVMHTLTGSGAAGSTLSFTFEGTGISVYGALNQSVNREVVQANFAIDNESSVTYSPQPPSSFKFNNLYFNETNLEPGNHTMKVSTLTDATIWIDYLLVTPINATALASSNSTTSTSFPVPSSTTSPAPDSSNRTHIATGAIVGGVIGGVFGLIAGILLVSFFMRRRRRKQYHDAHYIAPCT